MSYWMDFGAWKERHRELVREAERGRLACALPHADYPKEAGAAVVSGGRTLSGVERFAGRIPRAGRFGTLSPSPERSSCRSPGRSVASDRTRPVVVRV